ADDIGLACHGSQGFQGSLSGSGRLRIQRVLRAEGEKDERAIRPFRPFALPDQQLREELFVENGGVTAHFFGARSFCGAASVVSSTRRYGHGFQPEWGGEKPSGMARGVPCGLEPMDTGPPPRFSDFWVASSILTTRSPARPSLNGRRPELTQSRK